MLPQRFYIVQVFTWNDFPLDICKDYTMSVLVKYINDCRYSLCLLFCFNFLQSICHCLMYYSVHSLILNHFCITYLDILIHCIYIYYIYTHVCTCARAYMYCQNYGRGKEQILPHNTQREPIPSFCGLSHSLRYFVKAALGH